jgi:hypothetical protein
MYRVQHPTKALRQSAKAVHYIITHGSKARKLVRFEKGRHHNLVQADENVMVQWIDASEHCLQTSLYLRGQLHTWIPIHGPLCAYTFHLSICAFILGVRGIKLTTVFFPRSAAAHNDPAAFLVDLTSATFNVVCARGQLRTVADAHLLSAIAASYLSASLMFGWKRRIPRSPAVLCPWIRSWTPAAMGDWGQHWIERGDEVSMGKSGTL